MAARSRTDSHGAMQMNTEARRNGCEHFSFARKLLGAMNVSPIQVCAAWTFGSLVVVCVPVARVA